MVSVNLLDEDLLLWSKFRNGSADAFGKLMRTHYPDLFHYATRFTKDEQLVKECIQDIFLNLWFNRLTISETTFVKYYLLKTLRHSLTKAIQLPRRSMRRTEPHFDCLANTSAGLESALNRDEQATPMTRKLRKVIAGLSKRQQEVIYLRFYMDADIEEAADIMTLSRQSSSHLLHDALHRLRRVSPKKIFWFPHLLP